MKANSVKIGKRYLTTIAEGDIFATVTARVEPNRRTRNALFHLVMDDGRCLPRLKRASDLTPVFPKEFQAQTGLGRHSGSGR